MAVADKCSTTCMLAPDLLILWAPPHLCQYLNSFTEGIQHLLFIEAVLLHFHSSSTSQTPEDLMASILVATFQNLVQGLHCMIARPTTQPDVELGETCNENVGGEPW
jgi:hypothetical protein